MQARMNSTILLIAFFCLVLAPAVLSGSPMQAPGGVAAASEQEKTRPSKEDITALLAKIGKMSRAQQSSALEAILKHQSASRTPRSDFLYCVGLAYQGQTNAQICMGNAYENGVGVVEDAADAFVWYSIALEGAITDHALQESTRAAQQRVKGKLVQGYPSPTDEELEATVNAEKARIKQFQPEASKAPRK